MTGMQPLDSVDIPPMQDKVSAEEWKIRVDLAAAQCDPVLMKGAALVYGQRSRVLTPAEDGTNIPTCSYNVLYREKDARFADAAGFYRAAGFVVDVRE